MRCRAILPAKYNYSVQDDDRVLKGRQLRSDKRPDNRPSGVNYYNVGDKGIEKYAMYLKIIPTRPSFVPYQILYRLVRFRPVRGAPGTRP